MSNNDIKCRVIEEELRSIWPEWHVVCRLGGGAFGDVFQICREKLGIRENSALKVIQVSDGEDTVEMPFTGLNEGRTTPELRDDIPKSLQTEIEILEMLRGAPNIVRIEDFYYRKEGDTDSLFVRMELLESIEKVLSGKDREHIVSSVSEIKKLGKDICTALMYCEKMNILHRDIKPANLFVDKFGNYKVGDFGVSKRLDRVPANSPMTRIGTVSYMAPEIFRGLPYNNTVDIYSLGLVLYQLLNNGKIPFLRSEGPYTRQDIDTAGYERLQGRPIPELTGRTVGGEYIDRRLNDVVLKACATDPANRYQTAKEFYDALIQTETAEKSSMESDNEQCSTIPSGRQARLEKNVSERSIGNNKLLIFIPLIALFVAISVVLLVRGGFLSDAYTDISGSAAGKNSEISPAVSDDTSFTQKPLYTVDEDGFFHVDESFFGSSYEEIRSYTGNVFTLDTPLKWSEEIYANWIDPDETYSIGFFFENDSLVAVQYSDKYTDSIAGPLENTIREKGRASESGILTQYNSENTDLQTIGYYNGGMRYSCFVQSFTRESDKTEETDIVQLYSTSDRYLFWGDEALFNR